MMHDALRGDVFAALRAGAKKDAEGMKEVQQDLAEHVKQFRNGIKENHERTLSPEITAALKAIDEPLENYIKSAEGIIALATTDAAAAELKFPDFLKDFRSLEERMSKVSDLFEKESKAVQAASNAGLGWFVKILGGATAGAAVLLVLLSSIVSKSIPKPFRKLSDALMETANHVLGSASHLVTTSQVVADAASEQASSLEQTSASLEEMSSMTKRNSENAQSAKELAGNARRSASEGMEQMKQMREAMQDIKAASDNIARILKSIDEVAFQTNILALNAAVEAARAGEAGMGFAVVADEVRNLAQRSALAAHETASKIEDCITKSNRGVQITETVAKSLQEIVTHVTRMDELVAEIAIASKEQTLGISQINTAVSEMDKITQNNAGSAEESASAAQELNRRSHELKETVQMLRRLVGGAGEARIPRAQETSTGADQTSQGVAPARRQEQAYASTPRNNTPPSATAPSSEIPMPLDSPEARGTTKPVLDEDFKSF